MNNEQLYKDFEALNKEASLGGGLNRIEKQHACGRMTAREPVSYTHLTLPTTPYV